jgi:hypothetical protein
VLTENAAQVLSAALRIGRPREQQFELALQCLLVSQRPNQIL